LEKLGLAGYSGHIGLSIRATLIILESHLRAIIIVPGGRKLVTPSS
jgi:hypothetical protein